MNTRENVSSPSNRHCININMKVYDVISPVPLNELRINLTAESKALAKVLRVWIKEKTLYNQVKTLPGTPEFEQLVGKKLAASREFIEKLEDKFMDELHGEVKKDSGTMAAVKATYKWTAGLAWAYTAFGEPWMRYVQQVDALQKQLKNNEINQDNYDASRQRYAKYFVASAISGAAMGVLAKGGVEFLNRIITSVPLLGPLIGVVSGPITTVIGDAGSIWLTHYFTKDASPALDFLAGPFLDASLGNIAVAVFDSPGYVFHNVIVKMKQLITGAQAQDEHGSGTAQPGAQQQIGNTSAANAPTNQPAHSTPGPAADLDVDTRPTWAQGK